MANEKEGTVKKVIEKLRDYLQKYLSIDEDFIRGLQAKNLLDVSDASRFCATLSKGGNDALYSFLDHVSAHFVKETLEMFCTFLDDHSKDKIRPRLGEIATEIRAEMKKHQPGTMGHTDTQQDGDLVPTVRATQGETTPTTSTTEERSLDKIKEIVKMYRSGDYTSCEQISTLKGTLCKDHLDTIEKVVEGYQKMAAFLEASGLLEGKSLSIDLCQLAVKQKAEVDSMLEVLQTKQKELQSDEYLSQLLKGRKRKAVLKGQLATPKTASEKENSAIYFEDDTDIELSSSDSEEIPQKRPESTPKVWKEEEDASSLHRTQDKLTPSFVTLVGVFKDQVYVTAKSNHYCIEDSIILSCQATLAKRQGSGKLPGLGNHFVSFSRDILENTTIFDIEMIHLVANHFKQPALTEAVEKYEAALKPLMEASISELTERYIVEPVVQDPSKQAYKLVLKCPRNQLVRELYDAQYYLEKYLGIPEARLLTFPKRW